MVGSVVIMIVVTAGMVSTTWVQFLKGALLVVFSTILTWLILERGFKDVRHDADAYQFKTLADVTVADLQNDDGRVGKMTDVDVLPTGNSLMASQTKPQRLRPTDGLFQRVVRATSAS